MANSARNMPGTERTQVMPETNALDNVQIFYEKNKNMLNTVAILIVVAIAGYFIYQKMYKMPRQEKAGAAISYAQRYFQADSLNLALNGDGQHLGFLKVMKKYDGTATANLCQYYAGVCYLKMGDYSNAIKYLKDFDGHGTMIGTAADGALGDAYMENNNISKGIEYYNKATGDKDDVMLTPLYLYREGVAYEMQNKPDEAKKLYQRIRSEYPRSMQARDIDKALARLGDVSE